MHETYRLRNFLSDTDCYGFEKDRNVDQISYENFVSDYIPTLARRTKRWENIYRPSKMDQLPQGFLANRRGSIFFVKVL